MRVSAQIPTSDAGRRTRVNCEMGGLFGLGTVAGEDLPDEIGVGEEDFAAEGRGVDGQEISPPAKEAVEVAGGVDHPLGERDDAGGPGAGRQSHPWRRPPAEAAVKRFRSPGQRLLAGA